MKNRKKKARRVIEQHLEDGNRSAAAGLQRVISDTDRDPKERVLALELYVGSIGMPDSDKDAMLEKCLNDSKAAVQAAAVSMLADGWVETTIPEKIQSRLLEMRLHHPYQHIRNAAKEALER